LTLSHGASNVFCAVLFTCLAATSPAVSADLPPPNGAPPMVTGPAVVPEVPYIPGDQFEATLGVYTAGVGSVEHGTVDINGSFGTPRLNPLGITGFWEPAIPRFRIGAAGNLEAGRTSFAYADFVWTIPIIRWLYLEPFFGGAVHNGSDLGSATQSDLGCRELFHVGMSVGVPIDRHWSVLGTFEHLSNGKGVFGINCGTNQVNSGGSGSGNQGLNNYGLSARYAF
jgi:Lipid A 3-O-deacylase (PagL)